jgi:uncharacterized membrane protein YdjX (TVP38/TMEM64 family)
MHDSGSCDSGFKSRRPDNMSFEFLQEFLSAHPIVAPFVFIILRALAIIIPPIPGILIDIPGIALWGAFPGFIYGQIGIMLGAMVSFWIARRYREPLLSRFIPLQIIHRVEKKLSENQKFWAMVLLRLPSNALFDYISYVAGLTKISSARFFFSSLIGSAPLMFVLYYFGQKSLNIDIYIGIILIVGFFIIWKIFSKKDKMDL